MRATVKPMSWQRRHIFSSIEILEPNRARKHIQEIVLEAAAADGRLMPEQILCWAHAKWWNKSKHILTMRLHE